MEKELLNIREKLLWARVPKGETCEVSKNYY